MEPTFLWGQAESKQTTSAPGNYSDRQGVLQRDEASGEKRALRLGLDHVVRGPLRR